MNPGGLATVSAAAIALSLGLGGAPRPAVAGDWVYVIDQARAGQQGNFCDSRREALEVARAFELKGPRHGYEALSETDGCSTDVITFTPREIIKEVVIAKGKKDEYKVRFVRVETDAGATRYMVTTRDVRAPK